MTALLPRTVVLVWGFLMVATALSWWLGTDHGVGDARTAGTLVLVIAFVKALFVVTHFMELRQAPAVLQAIVGGVLATCLLGLVGIFLWG